MPAPPTWEPAEVERYLASHLGPLQATSVRRSFPGHSRETLLVETAGGDGYVVRVEHPGGALVPVPLRVEYEVYRRLWPSPVPVAEPLWYAEDVDFAEGRPHMVRRLVDGSPRVPGLARPGSEGDELRRAVAYEMAEQLARVHTLDWRAYGFDEVLDVPPRADDALGHELRRWREIFRERRSDPFPLLTEAMYWLEEQLPPGGDRLSLLKGNNGLGEEIWRDGQVVALSDWELAALGDPAMDWAFSQGLLGLHDADDTLDHYAQATGFAIDRARLAWALVWTRVKASITTNGGLRGYLDGTDVRSALAAMGIGIVKGTELWLARHLGHDVQEVGERVLASQRSPYLAELGA